MLQEAPAHDWSQNTDDTSWLYPHTFPVCFSYFARVTLLKQRSAVVAEFSEGLQYFHCLIYMTYVIPAFWMWIEREYDEP